MLSRLLFALVFLGMTMGSAFAQSDGKAPASRVLFLPFDGSAAGKYTYLVDGIRTMLASRLSAKSGVQLVDYSLQESEIQKMMAAGQGSDDARAVYNRLQTDYVINGALYATNTGLKIQVGLSSAEMKAAQTFSSLMENEDQVIKAVVTLVEEITQKMFGVPGAENALQDDTVVKSEEISGFRTEHPEKMYKKGALGGGAIVTVGENEGVSAKGVKRSSTIPAVIVSMDVGDLDGDGEKEIVFASHTALQVFRFADERFQKLTEFELLPTYKIHAVNIADLDKDGKSEIFVSGHERMNLSSMILGWSAGNGMKVLSKNIRYYLRPIILPGEGLVLAGQYGNALPEQGFVQPGIFKLTVGPSYASISRGQKIPLPPSVYLFDFIRVDLDANGTIETVAIDRNERLLVYDSQNNLLWVSDEEFGGSRNYVGEAKGISVSKENRTRTVVFVPTKLLARDINGDGKPEIVIGQNKRVSYRFLENARSYEGGNVTCLAWKDSSMEELWRTNTIAGYIADYSFSIAGEGKKPQQADLQAQLYVGQVPADTFLGLLSAKESKLLVYEMNIGKKGEPAVK